MQSWRTRRCLSHLSVILWFSAGLSASFGCAWPLDLTRTGGVSGHLRVLHADAGEEHLGAAVVYLDDLDDDRPHGPGHEKRPYTLVFGGRGTIDPPLLAVPVGQPVLLELRGGVRHQPFTYSLANGLDAPADRPNDTLLEGDQSREITLDRSGVVRIYCSLHRKERAVIFVSDSPYFSAVDSHGRYGINDVPAGSYRLVLWSEVVEGTVRSIRLDAGRQLDSNIWIDARKISR